MRGKSFRKKLAQYEKTRLVAKLRSARSASVLRPASAKVARAKHFQRHRVRIRHRAAPVHRRVSAAAETGRALPALLTITPARCQARDTAQCPSWVKSVALAEAVGHG